MPEPEAVEAVSTFKAQLLRQDAKAARELVNAYGGIFKGIQDDIKAVTETVVDQQLSFAQAKKLERLQALERQVEREVNTFSKFANRTVTTSQGDAASLAQQATKTTVDRALPAGVTDGVLADAGISWNTLPSSAFENFIGISGDGKPLANLLDPLGVQARRGIVQGLGEGIARGFGPRKTAALMRQRFGVPLSRALALSRTETLRAYREATRAQYDANTDIVTGWRRVATLDDATCFACIALDGTLYATDELMDAHVNDRCHPAGTVVDGPLPLGASKRFYSGQLIRIRTASGNELSMTPNHPILTGLGWLRGDALVEGMDVVGCSFSERTPLSSHYNNQDRPAVIEEVFVAASMVLGEMPAASVDLNGDGAERDVHVVSANGLLWDRGQAPSCEPLSQDVLGWANVDHAALPLNGPLDQALLGWAEASPSRESSGQAASLCWRHGGAYDDVGLSLAPTCNAKVLQPDADHVPPHAEASRQGKLGDARLVQASNLFEGQRRHGAAGLGHFGSGEGAAGVFVTEQAPGLQGRSQPYLARVVGSSAILRRCASEVFLDRILDVSLTSFSGHVYNLQTTEQWYSANGIVSHNCVMVPETISYADLGIDLPADTRKREVGEDWFRRQPESRQKDMMGAQKFQAWKDGKFDIPDMAKVTENRTWGAAATEKPLKELVA